MLRPENAVITTTNATTTTATAAQHQQQQQHDARGYWTDRRDHTERVAPQSVQFHADKQREPDQRCRYHNPHGDGAASRALRQLKKPKPKKPKRTLCWLHCACISAVHGVFYSFENGYYTSKSHRAIKRATKKTTIIATRATYMFVYPISLLCVRPRTCCLIRIEQGFHISINWQRRESLVNRTMSASFPRTRRPQPQREVVCRSQLIAYIFKALYFGNEYTFCCRFCGVRGMCTCCFQFHIFVYTSFELQRFVFVFKNKFTNAQRRAPHWLV